ncbi:TPA: class I SAM-dependent methyltransferase [Stenotrophomonas maltophilia]|uniref:class I SAM-dependent methyltransferase n=1 Tax=Stenotrophomonas TaxID=40323 RepID=UPI000D17B4FD|nr:MULTISPECIES: SAM-dependent methyltransferase [unclassified Stenotrophomonas]PTA72738.1 SAM-dependent methyltransferase [Stenotrophomonas sp. Nf1]PTA82437.1 SAM-dependent methyltransferase [Stenotrophomonas sp. Nf4]
MEWMRSPFSVGALLPSGQRLAQAMTQEIIASDAPVLELGPGTGVFTHALLARGIEEVQMTLLESNVGFSHLLEQRFPLARVLRADATSLGRLSPARDVVTPGVVVSGLPLLAMSTRSVFKVMAGVFRHLREGGALYQFSYGPRCPVPASILNRLGLTATRTSFVLLNAPPAFVYRITRK